VLKSEEKHLRLQDFSIAEHLPPSNLKSARRKDPLCRYDPNVQRFQGPWKKRFLSCVTPVANGVNLTGPMSESANVIHVSCQKKAFFFSWRTSTIRTSAGVVLEWFCLPLLCNNTPDVFKFNHTIKIEVLESYRSSNGFKYTFTVQFINNFKLCIL